MTMTKIMFIDGGDKVRIYTSKCSWFTVPYRVYKELWSK